MLSTTTESSRVLDYNELTAAQIATLRLATRSDVMPGDGAEWGGKMYRVTDHDVLLLARMGLLKAEDAFCDLQRTYRATVAGENWGPIHADIDGAD